jgi:RNA polymerase sigma factor (TIGR02999 family)
LTPIVCAELHRVAAVQLGREGPGHTFSPTDLVSEAFLRLVGEHAEYADRVHFFAVAAGRMRRMIVDHARERAADKRGGSARPEALDETLVSVDRPADLCALDDALDALAAVDERRARVVELHHFGGLGHKEIAAMISVPETTVARDLRLAEAWLRESMMDVGE